MFDLLLTVKILKWDEYNPRKDYKKPWWFALSNTLIDDPEFYSFNHGEFKAWIYVLSMASRKTFHTVNIDLSHADRVSNISKKDFISSIKKLEQLKMVTAISTDSVRETVATEHNNTKQDRTEHNNTYAKDSFFDFESIYKNYPRKLGKAKAFKVLSKTIKTQEDFDSLSKAVSSYALDCQLNRTPENYIKHFSSFIGTSENETWRDYITLVPLDRSVKTKMNKSEQREQSNKNALNQVLESLGAEKV